MFSASETSITVARSAKLSKLKSDGNKKADIVLDLKKKKEQVISSILLGNNLTNILSSIFTFIAIEFCGNQQLRNSFTLICGLQSKLIGYTYEKTTSPCV